MIKKILFIFTFATFLFSTAQMSVRKSDGTEYVNNQTFSFNTYATSSAALYFSVYNTSTTSSITVKALCETLTNTNGSLFQFCFSGNCMFQVQQGQVYPLGGSGNVIPPGQNTGTNDYFENMSATSSSNLYPMTLKFKFYMVDGFDLEYGTPFYITYQYNGILGVKDTTLANTGLYLKNSNVKDAIFITSELSSKAQLLDMSGKKIMSSSITKGENTINVPNIPSGMYILSLTDKNGQTINQKIIKN